MSDKIKIISISPTPSEYIRAVCKLYIQNNNIDKKEIESKFDIVEGSKIGGMLQSFKQIKEVNHE